MSWLRRTSKLAKEIGEPGCVFLEHGLRAIERILPHVEVKGWVNGSNPRRTGATWDSIDRRKLNLAVSVLSDKYPLHGSVQRRRIPRATARTRTLDDRERLVCEKVIARVARILGPARESDSLRAIRRVFDEEIVASYLRDQFGLEVEVGEVFRELRKLAEETYENKSLSFGLLLDAGRADAPNRGERFPDDVLGRKRYRALSDGYRTGYLVSRRGAIIGFQDIELLRRDRRASANNFYPEWAEDIALASREKRIGMSLTRQGDLLVFDAGSLRFTYRYGRWQYWNHTHLIELLRTSMRVHRVPQATVLRVVRAVYRAAIDVSFRRSGGLFVILHSERHMRHVVRQGDGIKDERRDHLDRAFDKAMRSAKLQDLPRRVVVELAALDGAIVMNGAGTVLAYGAVLDPDKKGRIGAAEGSRTKAAIGASHYGVAVKVSSDGDITVFVDGKELIRV